MINVWLKLGVQCRRLGVGVGGPWFVETECMLAASMLSYRYSIKESKQGLNRL
jgi:hypothetical protein